MSVSTTALAYDADEVMWEQVGRHRGNGMRVKSLPVCTDGTGYNFWASIGVLPDGYYSPRHRHNFDQIRFVIAGSTQFSAWELGEGECGYFPESVPYGPQEQHGDATILTLQFSGASGCYYPTPGELQDVVARLREEQPDFGTGGVGLDEEGRQRDSFELAWECLRGEPIAYAEPRYGDVVVMRPAAYQAQADDLAREITRLGVFTERGLEVLRV